MRELLRNWLQRLFHYYDTDIKEQNQQWTGYGSLPPKTFNKLTVMASAFCDAAGVLLIDYLSHGQSITREYYFDVLLL